VAALVLQTIKYFVHKDIVLCMISGSLIILSVIMVYEIIRSLKEKKACIRV